LKKAQTIKRFVSQPRDILADAFCLYNRRKIASCGRDKNFKIWNTIGECKFIVEQGLHTDYVSAVKFFQDANTTLVVSVSWDKTVKVWDNTTMTLKYTFVGHKAQVNSLVMPPKTF
jgi:WD40 repeat protein